MTDAQLVRVISGKNGTFGVFLWKAIPICLTLEDPWLGNRPNISCIPPGVYHCETFNGQRFKAVWEVTKVPDRSAILIHTGNTIHDTRGCILVGQAFGTLRGIPGIMDSVGAMQILRKLLPEEFDLTITQQPQMSV